jgi:hypothetical protein
MAPRKRKPENRHLPQGLSKITMRNVLRFRYRYPNGKDVYFPIGTLELDAIEAATIFNTKHRNPTIKLLMDYDEYNKPLKDWLVIIKKRVYTEEFKKDVISEKVYAAFENDLVRLNQMHGAIMSKSFNLSHVNDFLNEFAHGKSNEVYNRKITFLKKVGSYLCDMSAMETNFADSKKRKPKDKKQRQRLTLDNFNDILSAAESWLKTSMMLSIQTTHAVNEISLAKYKDCEWYSTPVIENNLTVYGVLRIHRQKVKDKEASRVAIPITKKIKTIIEQSRTDNIASPYIIHKILDRRKGAAKGIKHHTQLDSVYISRAFSDLRDRLGVMSSLPKDKRPTFHEIRALSIHLYDEMGYDVQARAAHTDSESTKVYKKDHVEWVEIQAAELAV